VRLPGADAAASAGPVQIRLLDQHTVERATMDPKGFLRDGEERAVQGGTATVTLKLYRVARLEFGRGARNGQDEVRREARPGRNEVRRDTTS
jgi:hypothetical protein